MSARVRAVELDEDASPTVNVDLIRRVMAHIREHPETWDQTSWTDSCGTRACFAGWAVLLTHGPGWLAGRGPYFEAVGRDAERLLGLTQEEGNILFDPSADWDPDWDHYPTFEALVTEVTGVTFP